MASRAAHADGSSLQQPTECVRVSPVSFPETIRALLAPTSPSQANDISVAEGDVATLRRAAALLLRGMLVAMPTETVYGLAANALDPEAVLRIFSAKGRPADNPLIVHVSSLSMLQGLYPPGWIVPPAYSAAIQAHWPGPLTILLPRSPLIPDAVTCGQATMAVRMPAHAVALALIEATGVPLAAPSANSSGR